LAKGNLATYIKRGNIVLEPDGKTIDDTRPENAYWVKNRREKAVKSAEKVVTPDAPTLLATAGVKISPKVKKAAEKSTINKFDLDIKKTEAELRKKEVDTEIALERLAVMKGDNIPIALVKEIISQLSKSFLRNYKSFSEQTVVDICHQHGISELERVTFTGKLVGGLNALHSKSVNDAKAQLKNAIGTSQHEQLEQGDEE